MMFIDDDPAWNDPAPDTLTEIDVRDLLAACATEAWCQARAAASLDVALGAALTAGTRTSGNDAGMVGGVGDIVPPAPGTAAALQQADLFRQEMAGLAHALALVVEYSDPEKKVPADRVRACTPLQGLQRRLVAPQSGRG